MSTGVNPAPRKRIKKLNPLKYAIEEEIRLPAITKYQQTSFFKVINNRKSERQFSNLTQKQISNLLWYSAKTKIVSFLGNNIILSHRNAPSAGAIHPIDIFISLPGKLSERVLYYYNPYIHVLHKCKFQKKMVQSFFRHVNNNLSLEKATLIWFAIDIQRTASKYKNPESLVWRDAGALIMLFQLVATALKIKSCPLGTLANPYFLKLFSKESNIISGGGILFG